MIPRDFLGNIRFSIITLKNNACTQSSRRPCQPQLTALHSPIQVNIDTRIIIAEILSII